MRKAEALNQLRTIREQIRKVTVMMQEEAHCIDILQKIFVIQHAMNRLKRDLRHAHLESCIIRARREKNEQERKPLLREVLDIFGA